MSLQYEQGLRYYDPLQGIFVIPQKHSLFQYHPYHQLTNKKENFSNRRMNSLLPFILFILFILFITR